MKVEAIVFDFDGVLVESTDVKTHAFAELYAASGEAVVRRVVEYHLAHAGVSRYVKFKVWQEDLLGIPYTEADGERLSTRFSQLVVERIVGAPYVRGALEFLKAHHKTIPLYVASGTPTSELREIVRRRGMQSFFAAVRGTPQTKAEILRSIISAGRYTNTNVVMIGDATADLCGASEAGTRFIGRVAEEFNPFQDGTEVIADLSQLDRVLALDGNRSAA